MHSNFNEATKVASDVDKKSECLKTAERHRAALVRLGYLERRKFHLSSVQVPSEEADRLRRELVLVSSEPLCVEMHGHGEGTEDMVVVYDRPDAMARWEAVIARYDTRP